MKTDLQRITRGIFLVLACGLTASVPLSAQTIEDGVYNIVNVERSGNNSTLSMAENADHTLSGIATNMNDYNQLWIIKKEKTEEVGYTLRNAASSRYVKVNESFATQWTTSTAAESYFRISGVTGTSYYSFNYQETNYYSAIHLSGGNQIVRWEDVASATASHWSLNKSAVTEKDITASWSSLLASARAELNTLIDQYESALETACSNYTGTSLVLQTGNPAASNYLSTNAQQMSEGPIAYLIDNDLSTFFHSKWNGTPVEEPHYLQLDAGEGKTLKDFYFTYTTRLGSHANKPKKIVVSGSNDGTDFTEIRTIASEQDFYSLPVNTSSQESYTSCLIHPAEGYRYWRFTVTATNGGSALGEYPFFALSEFGIIEQTVTMAAGYERKELTAAYMYNLLNNARSVYSNSSSIDEVTETKTALSNSISYITNGTSSDGNTYPFTLTTDAASPSLYTIRSNRGDYYYTLTNEGKIRLSALTSGNMKQYWFFMPHEITGNIMLVPFADPTMTMGCTAGVTDGKDKVVTVPPFGKNNTYTYVQVEESGISYALNPVGYRTYLSNHSGPSYNMGYYNNLNDVGTLFTLGNIDLEHSYAYYTLQSAIVEAEALGVTKGSNPGEYPELQASSLLEALAAAKSVLNNSGSDDPAFLDAAELLTTAQNALTINPIEADTYYVLRSANGAAAGSSYSLGCDIYVSFNEKSKTPGRLYWKTFAGAEEDVAVWQFEIDGSNKYLKNARTGQYIEAPGKLLTSEEKRNITVEPLGSRQFRMTAAGTNPIHAQNDYSEVVSWAGGINSASAWYIQKVDLFAQSITLNEYACATFCAGYSVTVPAGVTAYYCTLNGENAALNDVGSVIPAHTAVVLKGAANTTYSFEYTTTVNAATIVADNILTGTLVDSYIESVSGNTYYVLGAVEGRLGFYLPTYNTDATGAVGGGTTHFKNNAGKAYLTVRGSSPANGFVLRFAGDDETPTGILSAIVPDSEEGVIYDMSGRRISKITRPGLYIMNGKKLFVQ